LLLCEVPVITMYNESRMPLFVY